MKLTRLFEPITIRNMKLKNRVIMPAIHHLYTPDGFATERFNAYYWRRAEGGADLIFVGGCRFDDYGGTYSMMSLQTDEYIAGYKEFTDGMHARGAKVGVQLYHAGRYAPRAAIPNEAQALAPSAVYSKLTRDTPKEMTIDELRGIIRHWAAAAVRAKNAGFDIVEITASAGYLICQFLSPLTNLRTDQYGGSWENRTRFARELLSAVREAVGPDYPISMRVSGNDFMEGSNTNQEAVAFCKLMESAGVDFFNVTGGWHETVVPQLTGELPKGGFSYLARNIKDAVSVPVATSNRINDPIAAERILAIGDADIVSIGRAMIADPDWVKKAYAGDFDEIRRCVACNQGCLSNTFFGKPAECLVNGSAGREHAMKVSCEPSNPMRILVVGGGAAGCEFALQAANQGHQVTLWEKEGKIGGQLHLAATPPGKREFQNLPLYHEACLKQKNVKITLGIEADIGHIMQGNFDAVVTATGSIPNTIPFQHDGSVSVLTAYDILNGNAIAGKHVLVLGGGTVGCETAQYLAHEASLSPEQLYFMMAHQSETMQTIQGLLHTTRRNISIVDIAKIGAGFRLGTGWPVLKDLKRFGVRQLPFSRVSKIANGTATIAVIDKKMGTASEVSFPCDTVVMAAGARPNDVLYHALLENGVNAYNLGDSALVGTVLDAIREATDLPTKLRSSSKQV